MKFTIAAVSAVFVAVALAQSASSVITIKPGCPTPMPDVMVSRSDVPVATCAEGNSTKPSIHSMGQPSATNSAASPTFTGAAGNIVVDSFAAIVGFGVVAGLVL